MGGRHMSDRDIGKARVLPSFSPEWEHPTRLLPSGRRFNAIVPTVGNYWSEFALTGESEPTLTRRTETFIGFRLVRTS
jgi:hypothetical protein